MKKSSASENGAKKSVRKTSTSASKLRTGGKNQKKTSAPSRQQWLHSFDKFEKKIIFKGQEISEGCSDEKTKAHCVKSMICIVLNHRKARKENKIKTWVLAYICIQTVCKYPKKIQYVVNCQRKINNKFILKMA